MARIILFMLVWVLATIRIAEAGEVGNIIWPDNPALESGSRDASATALRGFQAVVAALEQSELKQIDARKGSLKSASNILTDAANKMKAIRIHDNANIPINWGFVKEENLVDYIMYVRRTQLGENGPQQNVREVYNDFILLTIKLAKTMKDASESNDPILTRDVVNDASRYLSFGGAVSEIIEATLSPH
jgi:hypothetical protein